MINDSRTQGPAGLDRGLGRGRADQRPSAGQHHTTTLTQPTYCASSKATGHGAEGGSTSRSEVFNYNGMLVRAPRFSSALGLVRRACPLSAETKIKAVATFSILGNLIAEVAGDKVALSVLVGPDMDAHAYQPRPTDARALRRCQVLVSNGLGFEGWINRLAKAAPFTGPFGRGLGRRRRLFPQARPRPFPRTRTRSALLAGRPARPHLLCQHRQGPRRTPTRRTPPIIASAPSRSTGAWSSSTPGEGRDRQGAWPTSAGAIAGPRFVSLFLQRLWRAVSVAARLRNYQQRSPLARDVAMLIREARAQRIKACSSRT